MKNIFRFLVVFSSLTVFASCGGGGGGSGGDGTDLDPIDGDDGTPSAKLAEVCPIILDLLPGMNIKYKAANIHGGRGPTWIMGCQANSSQYWPPHNYLQPIP